MMATAPEILKWVAGKVLDRDPEPNEIPSEAEFAEWLPRCDDAAYLAAEKLWKDVSGGKEAGFFKGRVRIRAGADGRSQTINVEIDPGGAFADPSPESAPFPILAPWRLAESDGMAEVELFDIKGLHQVWLEAGEHWPHPLAPLVRAWQERERPARIDRRENGIMPAYVAEHVPPGAIVCVDPNYRMISDISIGVCPPDPSGQLLLPGLDPDVGNVAAFMLAILDAGSEKQRGAGAPLRDRFFAEGLMAAATQDRKGGGRFSLSGDDGPLTVVDLVEWACWKQNNYRPDKENYGLAMERAISAVNQIKVPLNERGGWLHSVLFEGLEGRRLTDRVVVSVRLMPGSEHGALVNRSALRQAGKVSAIAWRLYLALCFEWNRIAYRGRTPHLTRDEHKRNAAGYYVDVHGKTLTNRRGQPQSEGKNPRAVKTGRREPNPPGERLHCIYDGPATLARLAFPLGSDGSRSNPRRTENDCVKAARWLAGECNADGKPIILNRQTIETPAIRIDRIGKSTATNPDGFPWRIVPPRTR